MIGCSAVLRQRRWFRRQRILVEAPVVEAGSDKPIECFLQAQDRPVEFEVSATGSNRVDPIPKWSELVLILKTVGPTPQIERLLTKVKHQPA